MTDKPPIGSQEWLALYTPTGELAPSGTSPRGAVSAKVVGYEIAKEVKPAYCVHVIMTIALDLAWCRACGSIARVDQKAGVYWTRPQAKSPKEIEALRAELRAVHSDLGDASQSVFDLFESLKEKEAEIARQIAEHQSVVGKLTDTIDQLKRDLDIAKAAL